MPTRVAICLFEESINSLEPSKLLCGQPLTKVLTTNDDKDVSLYIKETNTNIPEWVEIVNGFSDLSKKELDTASSGAILFVKVKDYILACCFGSSVGNINRDNLITDFGLAAAYQRINKRNYKAIESQTLSINPLTNNRSSAIATTQDSFNIDNVLESITELSGKFYLTARSVIVTGKEFFSIPSPLNLADIKKLCADLLEDYKIAIEDDTYKRLTATKKVKTKSLLDYLNDTLCDKLSKKDLSISLIDYELSSEIDSYSFGTKDRLTEISIEDLYKTFQRNFIAKLLYLKTKKINIYDSNNNNMAQWSLYKCLFIHLSTNKGDYILYKGVWYEVEKRYINDLKTFISQHEIDSSSLSFPKWDGKSNEGNYNKLAASSLSGQCWDKILYTHKDYPYGIEFCDILTSENIIHVKKSSSSALNSHLLMQTAVSAILLQNDGGLRKWIKAESKKKFGKNILLNRNNEFKNPNIEYLILLLSTSDKSLCDSLPFFSLISFNLIIKRLIQIGFSVKISKA